CGRFGALGGSVLSQSWRFVSCTGARIKTLIIAASSFLGRRLRCASLALAQVPGICYLSCCDHCSVVRSHTVLASTTDQGSLKLQQTGCDLLLGFRISATVEHGQSPPFTS